MDPLVERVARNIRRRALLKAGDHVLVAVSGGVDSMVLLAVTQTLAARHNWKLVVAHFNHRLRGRASDADERLVRQQAAALGIPFVAGTGKVRNEAKQRKLSTEMAARSLRHQFLATTARQRRINLVALAHHADDQAELVLLRLLRGASTDGLGGMRWRSPSAFAPEIQLVRPLLDLPKAELLAFAARAGIAFREDASNLSTDHLRNRVRHDLLPCLERDYQPAIRSVLARIAESLSDDAEFIGNASRSWLLRARKSGFKRLPPSVQRCVLAEQLIAAGRAPDFNLIEQLRMEENRQVSAPGDQILSRDAGGKLSVKGSQRMEFRPERLPVLFRAARGKLSFGGVKFEWERASAGRAIPPKPSAGKADLGTEIFDAGQVGRRILLRHWQSGDRFQPIGLPSPVKLQDLFTNAKVPANERRNRVVAESESGEILWVEGLRIGERFKLDSGTRHRLKWCWHRT